MTRRSKKELKELDELSVVAARNWGGLFALGVLFVVLGCAGLSMVVQLTLVSIVLIGVLFLLAGVAQAIDVFRSRDWQGVLWHAAIAALYVVGGCLIIYDPALASVMITALLAWIFIIIGLTRLLMSMALRHSPGWGWMFLAGLTSVILGGLILMQWPMSALWIIGLFVAIELIMNGWSYIFIALSLRVKLAKK